MGNFACVMTQAVLAIIVEAIGSDSYNNEICLRLFTEFENKKLGFDYLFMVLNRYTL